MMGRFVTSQARGTSAKRNLMDKAALAAKWKRENEIAEVLANAEAMKASRGLRYALYMDYCIQADVVYLLRMINRRKTLAWQRHDGGARTRLYSSAAVQVWDDIATSDMQRREPEDWQKLLDSEIDVVFDMLRYKLRRLEMVHAFWASLVKTWNAPRQRVKDKRAEWEEARCQHLQTLAEIQKTYRRGLRHEAGGTSKDRREVAGQIKERSRGQEKQAFERATQRHLEAIADAERSYAEERPLRPTEIKKAARRAFEKYTADVHDKVKIARAEDRQRMAMRARLELAGCLLLPFPLPTGGVFPSVDYCAIDRTASASERFELLIQHANGLILKYGFLDSGSRRLLKADNDGCFCIMFAEELHVDELRHVYVPFFGVSGGPRGKLFSRDEYLQRLGVPRVSDRHVDPALGRAGERLVGRFFELFKFYRERQALGLKLPAKQAMLSYMQYLEKSWAGNDLEIAILEIERWNSIQCAEPSAVMAAAQLYYRMADMELSVPFEGTKKVEAHDATGHWGKETCGRCAISELCFAGVVASGERKQIKMCSVTVRPRHQHDAALDQEAIHRSQKRGLDEALDEELVYNLKPTAQAYPDPKRHAQFPALKWHFELGLGQSSSNRFWSNPQKQPRALSTELPGSAAALIKRFGLEQIIYSGNLDDEDENPRTDGHDDERDDDERDDDERDEGERDEKETETGKEKEREKEKEKEKGSEGAREVYAGSASRGGSDGQQAVHGSPGGSVVELADRVRPGQRVRFLYLRRNHSKPESVSVDCVGVVQSVGDVASRQRPPGMPQPVTTRQDATAVILAAAWPHPDASAVVQTPHVIVRVTHLFEHGTDKDLKHDEKQQEATGRRVPKHVPDVLDLYFPLLERDFIPLG
jgi:hypothetical protein